ncbi:MAG: T9SS type A sorting domain-containing protein, partial [Flavobacteriales bacterium]
MNFEDVTFKKILLSDFEINTNKDNEISIQEATLFDGYIDVSRKGIWSLVGIENFVNIESLNCGNNSIKTLQLTKNIKLTSLGCGNNTFKKNYIKKNR